MGARPIIGLASLAILAGGIVLQFFVILSGGVNKYPINMFYFLESTTNGVGNSAMNPTRWTFFALCGVDENGRNANCMKAKAALPFDPPRNFGTEDGLPDKFIGAHRFYLMSRFAFAFWIIALFFAICSLFTGLLAVCSRLGGYFSGFLTFIALFFQILASALMTAWVIEGRNIFNSNNQTARIGVKSMGFAWGTVGAFIVSMILFCSGGKSSKDHSHKTRSRRGGFFGRGKRRGFLDSESQRRVKDDY